MLTIRMSAGTLDGSRMDDKRIGPDVSSWKLIARASTLANTPVLEFAINGVRGRTDRDRPRARTLHYDPGMLGRRLVQYKNDCQNALQHRCLRSLPVV